MAIKVGFIGSGVIAREYHLPLLQKIKDTEIVSVCDIRKEVAETTASKYNCKPYTDWRQMLDKEKLDAVYICIPPFARGEPEIACAQKGIHLFIEKPVALEIEQANKMLDVIKKFKIITSVGYVMRYYDHVEMVKNFLKNQKIAFIKGAYLGRIYMVVPWWRIMNQSGGQLLEQATHIVDLARYLVGEVEEVYAVGYSGLLKDIPNYDIYDATVVAMKFSNGTIGEISCACLLNEAGNRTGGLKLFGRDLEVDISGGRAKVYEKGVVHEFLSKTDTFLTDAFLRENEIFIDAIKTNDSSKIKCDFYDGYKTFLVTYYSNQSILKGQPIQISM